MTRRLAPAKRLGHELPDRTLAEALDRQELDLARAAIVRGRHRCHEGLLAGSTAAAFAGPVPAQVDVVHLDPAIQASGVLAPGHHRHDLLLQAPGVGLLDPEPAPELDRADPVLGGRDQPHGQEPRRQRQLGGVEDGTGGERDLLPAGPALDFGRVLNRVPSQPPQTGETKPDGQRSFSTTARHCSSLP